MQQHLLFTLAEGVLLKISSTLLCRSASPLLSSAGFKGGFLDLSSSLQIRVIQGLLP